MTAIPERPSITQRQARMLCAALIDGANEAGKVELCERLAGNTAWMIEFITGWGHKAMVGPQKQGLPQGHKTNFDTLKQAFAADQVALLDCQDKSTGKPVAVLAAVERHGNEFNFIPFARFFDGNPYSELNPPNPAGGYYKG